MAVDSQILDESESKMDVKICKNIYRLRKDNEMTQAQVADYLGVSPQAVSKWEQEAAVPDVYLIPKIAFLFGVTIDTLFGTTNIDTVEMLVMKYSTMRNERHYREAKEAVDTLLEMNQESIEAYGFLCHLEYQRSLECISNAREASDKLADLAYGKNEAYLKRARLQGMRLSKMLGQTEFVDEAYEAFLKEETADRLNDLLIALYEVNRDQEALDMAEKYLAAYSVTDQASIYPNLMEVALRMKDFSYGDKCFDYIIKHHTDPAQVFNAWWMMWKLCRIEGMVEREETCRRSLLEQLPAQKYNEFNRTRIKAYLEEADDDFVQLL